MWCASALLAWKTFQFNLQAKRSMVDMLLLSVPYSDMSYPPCGPAVLKGIAESQGYSILTRDVGVDFFDFMAQYPELDPGTVMISWLNGYDEFHEHYDVIQRFYDTVVDNIMSTKCRYLGISVFSLQCHRFTMDLCLRLKQLDKSFKVVLGGKGISVRYGAGIEYMLTSAERLLEFHQVMKKRNLVDYTIIGDAEDAIIELLSEQFDPNDDSRKMPSSKELDYPFSNFDDFDIARYGITEIGYKQLPVVSSKGCVRSCDFCDVARHFVKFQSKNGTRLAEEMIYLADKYKIYTFALQDSIGNGNMKALTQMCEKLAEHNQAVDPSKKIKWAANWIARPVNSIKEHFFDLMAASGCDSLVIGAESGSNYVLEAMKKKTTVEGLFYEIEQMDRCGIHANINLIIGHWSERWQDFVDTIDMTIKLVYYEAKGTVTGFQIGGGFHALEHTAAADYEYSGVVKNQANWEIMWWSAKNPDLTAKVRFSRIYIFWKMASMLYMKRYYDVFSNSNIELLPLVYALQQSRTDWHAFYEPLLPREYKATCPSLDVIDDPAGFLYQRLAALFPTTKVKITLETSSCNGDPEFYFNSNGNTVYSTKLPPGEHQLEFDLVYDYSADPSRFEFGMRGKNLATDTEVAADGTIINDKRIMIKSLYIDNIDCLNQYRLFYKNSEYVEEGQLLDLARPGFFRNSSLAWEYQAPFWSLITKSNHNAQFYDHDMNIHSDLESILRNEIDKLPY